MIYIRDDLDGYAGWADTGALNAGADAHVAAANARTVTVVTLAYLQSDARGLRAITVAHPQPLVPIDDSNVPAETRLVQPRPRVAHLGRGLDNMLVTLTTGMTAAEVQSIIHRIDPGHHAGIVSALASLRQSMGDEWNRDLDTDTDQPFRPTLTLDRDREVMPKPDPGHVAQDRATIDIDLAAIDALRAMVATAIETAGAIVPMPRVVRQQTAWSVDLVAQAVTDAPSGRGWTQNDQAGQDRHHRPGNKGQITVGGDVQLPDFALAAVREAMPTMGKQATKLLGILLTLARDAVDNAQGGIVTIELDDLVGEIYDKYRGPVEAAKRRAAVWDQVRFIASLRVEGRGPRLRIKQDGKMVEMAWFHPLIAIEGVLAEATGQLTLDGLHPAPAVIKFRASDRLASDARLGNRALPVLGELGRVMKIPAGKPGGSWALAITHALVFEARKRSNQTVHVTREYLLTHYAGDPHPMDLLGDPKSSLRAVRYWKGALAVIRRDLPGLIEHIDDPEAPTGRGWAARWLAQRVLIRLGLDANETVGLRELIAGQATRAIETAHRRDLATIKADTIRKRPAKTAPPA